MIDECPQNLDELKQFGDTLETGDVLIMHCTHSFGKLAQLATKSPWDHCAMIVKCRQENVEDRLELIAAKPQPPSSTVRPWPIPGEPGYETTEVLEAMAGGSFTYPFSSHVLARGRFCKYIGVRRLRDSKGQPLDKERQERLEKFVQEFWGRPYVKKVSKGLLQIVKPILTFRKLNPHLKRDKSLEDLEEVFCSELIAEAFQAAGLLPDDTLNSNEILPSMFGPGKDVDRYLRIMNEQRHHTYSLGEVEVFKAPMTPLNTCIIETRERLRMERERLEEKERQAREREEESNSYGCTDDDESSSSYDDDDEDDDASATIIAAASSEEKKGLISASEFETMPNII